MTQLTDLDRALGTARTHIVIGDRGSWGKGYASEAVRLRQECAFAVMRPRTLHSATHVDNRAMPRVLEKDGYKRVGTMDHDGRPPAVYELKASTSAQSS